MPLPWERQWNTGPALPPDDDSVQAYITEAATKRGIPADDALRVWEGEGKGAWQSNVHRGGKREPSYGPYQLYTGGGLGNEFQKTTGLDPSDPATWKQGVDFALDHAKQNGWKPWYGAPPDLRSRGGYVDTESPSLGAVGARPWERQWNVPQGTAREVPATEMPEVTAQEEPQTWGEWGDDVSRSVISGVAGGLTGLAGLPGDVQSLGNQFEHWLNPEIQRDQSLPTSEDVDKWVRENIGDFSYDPKSGTGAVAQKVGLYGASGAGAGARTLAKGAIQTGATGLGAEVGEEVGGVPGEIVGAIAGSRFGSRPGVMGKAPKVTAADKVTAEADNVMSPATAAVKRASKEAYGAANNAGVVVRGQAFSQFLQGLQSKYPGVKIPGHTFRMGPRDLTVAEFDDIRSGLVKTSMRDPDSKKRLFAGKALDDMDDFFENPANIGVGNPREASAALAKARANWKIYRKSEMLDQIMETARDRAGQYSVSGNENAIRTGFRQLSTKINRDKRTRNLFTKDEIALIRQLSRGGRIRDLFKNVGAVLNARTMQGIGGLALGGAQGFSYYQGQGFDPWSAILAGTIYGVGKGSRAIGGAMAKGKANQLGKVIRSGGQMTSTPGDLRLSPMAGTLLGLKQSLGF